MPSEVFAPIPLYVAYPNNNFILFTCSLFELIIMSQFPIIDGIFFPPSIKLLLSKLYLLIFKLENSSSSSPLSINIFS